jgi:DAK2 domain fusion protein YloV
VGVLDALDAEAVRRWSAAAVDSLTAHLDEVDALNVFPIADADTGTNMTLTLQAGADALAAAQAGDAAIALGQLARGAVLGARGNSGVILAQLLRGLADAARDTARCDPAVLSAGLTAGVEQAYRAVADPVEGTILTVARAAANERSDGRSLAEFVEAAVRAADDALRRTPEQLPVLARAGVVDAGGRGLVLVLDALARTVTGAASPLADSGRTTGSAQPSPAVRETGSARFAFEVQYLLDAPDGAVTALRSQLAGLGDSVAVAGTGDGVWNVHVHANDVGAAIEAGIAAGTPRRITVVHFDDSSRDGLSTAERIGGVMGPRAGGAGRHSSVGTAVVAVAPGEGTAHLFEAEGVYVVDGSPSTADVVAAVRACRADEVVLLPNASRVTGVAEAAAEEARADGIRVTVVPTRSPVQGLAAIAVHDSLRRFDDDVVAMAEAAAATRFAEVTLAQRESLTSVGICQAGDILGLIDGEVVEIGHGLVAVAFALTDRLLGVGAELMTILVGAGAPAGVGDVIAGHVHDRAPLTDVTVYEGGQPDFPLIIGVE